MDKSFSSVIHIIDDDAAIQTSLNLLFSQEGYRCSCFSYPDEYISMKETEPDLILLDLNFSNDTSGKEGMSFLSQLQTLYSSVPVILITAWGTIPLAVEGVKQGAFDFITKPWNNDVMLQVVSTAIKLNEVTESTRTRAQLNRKYNFSQIIGKSSKIINILETISRVCITDASVLILGESGTGKELIAEAIHNNSSRKENEFVKVNLGGISSSLFESEMFGHKKGAYTDAYNDRKGRFEIADKGSIFLDEIGDLDLSSQVKLLRVLQDKTFQMLGDSRTSKTDVRVICATNRNLKGMVNQGTFREDLLYRINLITINLPPLRERKEDIFHLVNFFVENIKRNYQLESLSVNEQAMKMLETLPFYGNIRELKNLIERAYLITGNTILKVKDFKEILEQENEGGKDSVNEISGLTVDQVEKNMIIKALNKYKNNISKAAKSLGISRSSFYRRLEKYNIEL